MNTVVRYHKATLVLLVSSMLTWRCYGIQSASFATDTAHFYQTSSFHGLHPKLEHDFSQTLHISYANGSTKRGRDGHSKKHRMLDIFGLTNLRALIKGVSDVPVSVQEFYDHLDASDPDEDVGIVGFKGKLEVDDVNIQFRQNFKEHFFAELTLPFKKIAINRIVLIDESPDISVTNPQGMTDWQALKENLSTILSSFGLDDYMSTFDSKYRFDDMTLYAGWQDHKKSSISFINDWMATIRTGIIFPTGAQQSTKHPFAIRESNNHHWAFPIRIDLSCRSDRLGTATHLGTHAGVTFFLNHATTFRVKTNTHQGGLIRLEKKKLRERCEPRYFIGCYLLFDHFLSGLSILTAYSLNGQGRHQLTDQEIFNDKSLSGWHSHVFHWMLEFDCFSLNYFKKRNWAPYASFFLNYQPKGRNTFVTNTIGGTAGLEVTWKF